MRTKGVLAIGAAAATVIAVLGIAAGESHATGGEPEPTSFPTYTAPTGPELTPGRAADIAVGYAREWGEQQEVTIELGHGTALQAETLMEGGTLATAQARLSKLQGKPWPTFCLGGQNSPCTAAEVQHAKEVMLESAEAPAYLVALTGHAFDPPEHLRRGTTPVTGGKVLVVIDAHTGRSLGKVIGGDPTARVGELADLARFRAPAQSYEAYVAVQRPKYGIVDGTFSRQGEVVVFNGRTIFARARVRNGSFRIPAVYNGQHWIAGRLSSGRYCPAKLIVIVPLRRTTAHLGC